MEESDGKDLDAKASSDVITAGVFSNRSDNENNLVIAVSSSSTVPDDEGTIPTDRQSSGQGSEATSFELVGAVDADKAMDTDYSSEQIEQIPQLRETPEPERSTKNKCNLRKSLAWDSAFFTSDGVLDAEELSTMIGGGGKVVKNSLPGIEEEVYRSMDSISTLESENLTLESLEADLFEDIRASIQKSNRAANRTNSSSKDSSGKRDSQGKVSSSSKKADLAPVKQPSVRIKDLTSSIPKKISRTIPISAVTAKRTSLSIHHVKNDHDAKNALGSQKGYQAQASKVNGLTGSRRAVPKPSLSSKSSSLGSSTATQTEPTRFSSSGISGSSSGNNGKSLATIAIRKVDSKCGKPVANSLPKTPSRIGLKSRAPPVNSRLSSHLAPSNLSSSLSPASSISEWSIDSSSSTSSVNLRSISRGSIDTSVSQRSLDSDASADSALKIHPNDQKSDRNRNQQASVLATQTAGLSRPSSGQPTGLRMPSPKIGFFDAGKSGIRTPTRTPAVGMQSQPRLPTGLARTGAVRSSPSGSSNSAKSGKLPPPKLVAAQTNLRPKTEKTASPKQFQEPPSAKAKPSGASKGVKSSPVVSADLSDKKGEVDAPKIEISVLGSDNMKEITIARDEDGISRSSLIICTNSSNKVDCDTNGDHLVNKSPSKTDTEETGELELPKKVGGNDESCCELSIAPELCSSINDEEKHLNKSITENSRTPFTVKNSVYDTESDMLRDSGNEVAEKIASFSALEIGHKVKLFEFPSM